MDEPLGEIESDILRVFCFTPAVTVEGVAKYRGWSPAAAASAFDRLERRGYVGLDEHGWYVLTFHGMAPFREANGVELPPPRHARDGHLLKGGPEKAEAGPSRAEVPIELAIRRDSRHGGT